MNKDEYAEVFNGEETYEGIARYLNGQGRAVIGWTDQQGTHLDILFTLTPPQEGSLQRGLRGPTDLFVSVMGYGAHAWSVMDSNETDGGYVFEKLNGYSHNVTWDRVAELINEVRTRITLP